MFSMCNILQTRQKANYYHHKRHTSTDRDARHGLLIIDQAAASWLLHYFRALNKYWKRSCKNITQLLLAQARENEISFARGGTMSSTRSKA